MLNLPSPSWNYSYVKLLRGLLARNIKHLLNGVAIQVGDSESYLQLLKTQLVPLYQLNKNLKILKSHCQNLGIPAPNHAGAYLSKDPKAFSC